MTCRCAPNARCGRCEPTERVCGRCNGYGINGDEYVTESCRPCFGTGRIPVTREWRPYEPSREVEP